MPTQPNFNPPIVCLVTIVHAKMNFPIVDTVDINALNEILHYDIGENEFYVGKELTIIVGKNGETKKYIVKDVIFHYFQTEAFVNESRTFQGVVTPYNTQVMVYVDEL